MINSRKSILLILSLAMVVPAIAQRLPQTATPQRYTLTFTPDLKNATFAGDETIELQIQKPGTAITLNSAEIKFQSVTVTQGASSQQAQVSVDEPKEQATLTVPAPLAAGPATLHIQYTGILNDKLRGFYLAKTKLRNYATTQFEATDARRAFPSFDEPAFKAIFDISLVIDAGDTAISNGRIISDTPGPGEGKHTLKFSTTPKMSTYLVAMAVGDLQCNEGEAEGVPIRVCGTPDKKPLGVVAVRYAAEILKFYNQYYGIKYPYGKLDVVGVPDFEAGAMENTAAIFYRESLLFIDDKNSSVESHAAVFDVLAHEMAHQWFGDLVTMKWWDNIWLNEGFATWMQSKPAIALHPEWNVSLNVVRETNGALGFDSYRTTHPIRAKAETPDEINELFDAISYEKAAAVLRMIETYVSPEVFRRGINNYLKKFSYSNASAEDFWTAIAQASGRPVDKVMPTFVNQPGEPLISVKTGCVTPPAQSAGKTRKGRRRAVVQPHPRTEITLTQQRFLADGSTAPADQRWMIPICIKSADGKPFCQVFSERQETVPVSGCSSWVFVNSNASGYYRTQYDHELLQKLNSVVTQSLTTAERMSLLNDEAALVQSGQQNIGSYLDLVSALSNDEERAIVESYGNALDRVRTYLTSSSDRDAFHRWVITTFRPMMNKVGWTPKPDDTDEIRQLRADLVQLMGRVGEDQDTIRQATKLARQYLQDPASVDPTLAGDVLGLAARFGDAPLFDEYVTAMRNLHSPEQFYNVAFSLTEFRDPKLVERLLTYGVSPEVRNQDAPHLIAAILGNTDNQKVAWPWVKAHWQEVESKVTTASGAEIVGATRTFCDADSRDDVQRFFADHKVHSGERALGQAIERINACIAYKAHQQKDFSAWLEQKGGARNAGGN